MSQIVSHKLIMRLAALAAVTLSLILIVREDQLGLGNAQEMPSLQAQAPIIVARNEPNSPLVISAERQLAKSEQGPEVLFNVTNVTNKTITAFAIRLDVAFGSKLVSTVSLDNLELSATNLPPSRSLARSDTYENLAEGQHQITLSVDYVQFSDGIRWGSDSGKSAERVAGQHAAIKMLTMRLPTVMPTLDAKELPDILESMANIEPPAQHSDEWNDGFRGGARSLTNRLKRANQAGGLARVSDELSRFTGKRIKDQ